MIILLDKEHLTAIIITYRLLFMYNNGQNREFPVHYLSYQANIRDHT